MILVTGGAGYIGSHVVKYLLDLGYEVVIIDNLSTGNKAAVDSRAKFFHSDIRDELILNRILSNSQITCIMHFAGSCYVNESTLKPLQYYDNNVLAAITLLRKMLEYKVSKLIFSSSCAVYGNPTVGDIDETVATNPINPYGRTKLIIEQAIRDLSHTSDLEYVFLRYFNVAGADPSGKIGEQHDPETHLLPNILLHLLGKKDKIVVYGQDYATPDGTCIRDYIHVSDLAIAHITALESLLANRIKNECYNLGNERGYSVNEVIRMCEGVTGRKAIVEYLARRAGDPPKLVAAAKKIQCDLGWAPKYSLREIVETAWRWHRQL